MTTNPNNPQSSLLPTMAGGMIVVGRTKEHTFHFTLCCPELYYRQMTISKFPEKGLA
jgi:hypothetical protein